jgi:hypothetical protein
MGENKGEPPRRQIASAHRKRKSPLKIMPASFSEGGQNIEEAATRGDLMKDGAELGRRVGPAGDRPMEAGAR